MAGDAERGAEARGPRTSLVLIGTVLAGAIVAASLVGYRAWRDDEETDSGVAEPVETTVPATDPVAVPETRLFTRQTAAGVEIRVDSMADGELFLEEGGWGPAPDGAPAFCEVIDQVSASAISPAAVVQGGMPITKEAPRELGPATMWAPGGGMFGVLVQVPADVVGVSLRAPGGHDEMEPIDGLAVLVVVTEEVFDPDQPFGEPDLRAVTVIARHVDGRAEQVSGQALLKGPPVWSGDQACFPSEPFPGPVETLAPEDNPFIVRLPPAGADQPADPAAARVSVETVLDQLYGEVDPTIDPLSLIDDPFAMREMFETARENGFGEQLDSATVELEEVVFVSSVEAAFEYSLATSTDHFDELFGRARLVAGTWRVTRGTICRDLATMGVVCPP